MRSSNRGVYSGAVQFYFGDRLEQRYPATVRAITDCRFLALPAAPFAEVFRRWYPMAVHLLEGLFVGQRNIAELVGQRERLLAMGKLTAGLTHELNNPAAAASRRRGGAARAVRRHAAQAGACCRRRSSTARCCAPLTVLQEEFVGRIGDPRRPLGAGALGPRGRAGRLARRARGGPAVGAGRACSSPAGLGPRRPRPGRRRRRAVLPGAGAALAGLHRGGRDPAGGDRRQHAAGSRTWSTPPSSTRRWTAPRTSRPTCTPGSTPPW